MTSVNLIPMAKRRKQLAARRRCAWAHGLRTFAVFAAGVSIVGQLPTQTDATNVDRTALARVERRVESADREREQVRGMLVEARMRVETSKAVGHHPDWSVVLELLTRTRVSGADAGIDAVLHSVDISSKKDEPSQKPQGTDKPAVQKPAKETHVVRVVGLSPTPARVYRYVLGLEKLGVFDEATVRDTRPEKLGDLSVTRFELELVLTGPARDETVVTGGGR